MKRKLKKKIRNHSLQILVGILVIIPLFNEESWLRFIALGGFILILVNLIWFVINSEKILYQLFPTKSFRETEPNPKDKIWSHISMVLFFCGLIFLIFQMNNIENIIEEKSFWKNFGLLGFSIGLLGLFFLYRIRPSVFSDSGRRYSVVFGFILGVTGLTISTSSYLNKKHSNKEIIHSEYTIERKSTGGKKNKSHWVFIKIRESEKRFKIKPKLWNELKIGEKVLIKTQMGKFDYEFVTEIKPTANTV
jgi:glucan phosphoethanolaminetransferase (alkaline phosphatase superfamily)